MRMKRPSLNCDDVGFRTKPTFINDALDDNPVHFRINIKSINC